MAKNITKSNPIVSGILRNANVICFLSYCVGVAFFLAISLQDLNAPIQQQENALLPGLQQSHFTWNEGMEATRYNSIISDMADRENPSVVCDQLIQIMQQSGISAYTQEFSSRSPFPKKTGGGFEYKVANGTNLYGIIRAGRASSTESIVINVPMTKDNYNHAVGIALAFGSQIRGQKYWAKDIILLFSDMGYVGAQAWLQSYLDTHNSDFIKSSPLEERAGSILGALILDIPREVHHVNIDVVGNNGQLPNLDLFIVLVKLCRKEGVRIAVHDVLAKTWLKPMSKEGYMQSLKATMKMMSKQAKGFSSGNHAMFLQHNIQSLTLEGVESTSSNDVSLEKIGRIVEGVTRSMNNLLEKFHHSLTFYLLPSPEHVISIGLYMPPLGLIVLAPTLKALSLWLSARRGGTNDEDSDGRSNRESNDSVEEIQNVTTSIAEQGPMPWIEVSYILGLTYLMGVGLYFCPKFAVTWSTMFGLSASYGLLLIVTATYVVGLSLPFTTLFSSTLNDSKLLHLLRICALIIHAGTLGCVSVMNFSLGMLLAVLSVPFVMPIQPVSGGLKLFQILFALLSSPVTMALILASVDELFHMAKVDLLSSAEGMLRSLYEQSLLGDNWIFQFFCLLLYPNWLLFWILATAKPASPSSNGL